MNKISDAFNAGVEAFQSFGKGVKREAENFGTVLGKAWDKVSNFSLFKNKGKQIEDSSSKVQSPAKKIETSDTTKPTDTTRPTGTTQPIDTTQTDTTRVDGPKFDQVLDDFVAEKKTFAEVKEILI